MPTKNLAKFSSVSELTNYPNSAGIGEVGGAVLAKMSGGSVLNLASQMSLGSLFFLDPANGDDTNDGLSPQTAKATLDGTTGAFSLATAGQNDVIVLIGDGTTSATERLDAAFTWSKNATHLIGISSGVNVSNRSRIAPTSSTTAFANFFTVSGNGCRFENIAWFHGFSTGAAASIALTVSGERNLFINCHIGGMGDQEAADSATSRSVKLTGGENSFVGCTIGLDTVTRGAANASVELASGTARNKFIDCEFPFQCDAASPLGIKVGAAAGADRWHLFKNCAFINNIGSTSTAMSALATLAASIGGLILMQDTVRLGITEWGTDATSRGQVYIAGGGATVNGHTAGEFVVSSQS